jgi:hypothetical protein
MTIDFHLIILEKAESAYEALQTERVGSKTAGGLNMHRSFLFHTGESVSACGG